MTWCWIAIAWLLGGSGVSLFTALLYPYTFNAAPTFWLGWAVLLWPIALILDIAELVGMFLWWAVFKNKPIKMRKFNAEGQQ